MCIPSTNENKNAATERVTRSKAERELVSLAESTGGISAGEVHSRAAEVKMIGMMIVVSDG